MFSVQNIPNSLKLMKNQVRLFDLSLVFLPQHINFLAHMFTVSQEYFDYPAFSTFLTMFSTVSKTENTFKALLTLSKTSPCLYMSAVQIF